MNMQLKTEDKKIFTIKFKSYDPFIDFEEVKNIWLLLQAQSIHSYFVSWGWISTWVNSLPKNLNVRMVVGYINNEPVTAFFIGIARRRNHRFIPTQTASLNSTGNSYYDELTIEHNSILINPKYSLNLESIFDYLKLITWDELKLPGISEGFWTALQIEKDQKISPFLLVDDIKNSFYVDLQKIRDAKMNYLQMLSANKRNQVRRSIKQYELGGAIRVREAESSEEALTMLNELAFLHQREWTKRGKPGSFSNKYFYQFHQEIIQKRFSSKEIQILHIYNEKTTIGFLYNFIYNNNVLFYQSGLNYSTENTYRPGIVSHYYAILHNAKKELTNYDFLAGDSTYKKSLSTNSQKVYWVRMIKNYNRFKLEKKLLF